MPAPALTGGAALQPINLTSPAFLGLNTDQGAALLEPIWATLANNAVFDENNRLAARKGWLTLTTTPVTGVVKRVHEYVKADGTVDIISSTDADIFKGTATPTSVKGTLTITDGNIKFVNFNDKCIAFGIGTAGIPTVYTGSTFADITAASGTLPTSGIGTAAYGRLWVVDVDGKTIRYSAIIDETRWDTADGGGTIDMSKVWASGQDQVIGIGEFAGDLVIFGKNQVVVWTDGAGGTLGIDPDSLFISDIISGIGAITQFGITQVEGDLWFATTGGIESLLRARTEKNTPTNPVTINVEDEYQGFLFSESADDDLTLVYSPRDKYAICIFPTSGRQILIHGRAVQGPQGEPVYRCTTWTSGLRTAAYDLTNRRLVGSLTGTVGEIFQHAGYTDDGTTYSFSYESGWLDLGVQNATYIKWVKKITAVVFVGANTTVAYTLKYDFNTNARTFQATAVGSAGSLFSVSEFSDSGTGIGYKDPADVTSGESEFSGGITLRTMPIPGSGGGQYIKIGVSLDSNGGQFALQQLNIFAKIGRIANV